MTFSRSLENLGFNTYEEYLASEHWVGFKRRYSKSSRPKYCLGCGDKRYELHHTTYQRLGQERFADVMPLCAICHQRLHAILAEAKKSVASSAWALAQMTVLVPVKMPKRAGAPKEKAPMKKCPGCSQMIKAGKLLCRRCKKWMNKDLERRRLREWKEKHPDSEPDPQYAFAFNAMQDAQRAMREMMTGKR